MGTGWIIAIEVITPVALAIYKVFKLFSFIMNAIEALFALMKGDWVGVLFNGSLVLIEIFLPIFDKEITKLAKAVKKGGTIVEGAKIGFK